MQIKIVRNKYLNALLVLMLFSAVVHMLVVFYSAIAFKDFYIINYFNILDVDLFYPGAFDSFAGNVFSIFFVITAYVIILKSNKK
ncbi:MAG: hypothetical protein HYT35_00865 [Candidatus Staskawiczbacteria bacterium]|nr:hypothetical protein [Candidatus Staskawiczbacteria bacterium]